MYCVFSHIHKSTFFIHFVLFFFVILELFFGGDPHHPFFWCGPHLDPIRAFLILTFWYPARWSYLSSPEFGYSVGESCTSPSAPSSPCCFSSHCLPHQFCCHPGPVYFYKMTMPPAPPIVFMIDIVPICCFLSTGALLGAY